MEESGTKKMPLPIMVTVAVGGGVLNEGDPVGAAAIVFEFDVAHGLCTHEVTLEIMKRVAPAVDQALRRGLEAAKKVVEGGTNGNDQGPSNLVA